MVDIQQLERTLDLWRSMWEPREREQFEKALMRVLDGAAPEGMKLAALAACDVIATPKLVAKGARVGAKLDARTNAAVAAVAVPVARLWRHAERLRGDVATVRLLLEKRACDPGNTAADKLLDCVDVRDLYAVMRAADDDELVRGEAARRIARRGAYQRRKLLAWAQLDAHAWDDSLAVDVSLDDLDLPLDELRMPTEVEIELDGLTA